MLVHGVLGGHSRWDALRPHMAPIITVHAMDRRGRGASGDAPDGVVEREFEDVAAVVDAAAGAAALRSRCTAILAVPASPSAQRR